MQENATTSPPPDAGRRTVVSWLLGGGVAASLASFFYPVARFLDPPKVAEVSVNEVDAGKVQDLKPNSGKIVKFGNKPAILIRVNDTEWKAFSAVCTHLNCTVQYQASSSEMWCPCHNGTYDLEGRVVSGPPPKPLEEFAVKIRGTRCERRSISSPPITCEPGTGDDDALRRLTARMRATSSRKPNRSEERRVGK